MSNRAKLISRLKVAEKQLYQIDKAGLKSYMRDNYLSKVNYLKTKLGIKELNK